VKIVMLGTAAGGGCPQWNCRCAVCELAWAGDPRVRRRTQASLAVSVSGQAWCLLNCSPDIREQIAATDILRPRRAPRDSPVSDVVLTNADIDHIGGLLSLREGHRFNIHATPEVLRILNENPVFDVLDCDNVRRQPLNLAENRRLAAGLAVEFIEVPGKVPLYLEGAAPDTRLKSEFTVAAKISSQDGCFYYVPGCSELDPELATRLAGADLVFFDGTLWTDDELIRSGTGAKTARRMGHLPVGGSDGSLAALQALSIRRLIYTHINNTNPMLIEGSPECRAVMSAGAEIAYDGMELSL
jgi:pyrroloquinoline quinone biosynthesis protein B